MYIIGENIHIVSQKVKNALAERDAEFFQEMAVKQVEGGASAVDSWVKNGCPGFVKRGK